MAKTYAALLAATLFWGLSFIGTKIALETLTPYSLMLIRFSTASVLFLIFLKSVRLPVIPRKDHVTLMVTALFQPVAYFICETLGVNHTTASEAAIIAATIPLVIPVLSFLFIGERLRPASGIGLALSFAGIVLLVMGENGFALDLTGHLLGDALMGGAVLAASAYMILARELGRRYPAGVITALQMVYGTVFLVPFCWFRMAGTPWPEFGFRTVGAVAFLVCFATIGAFFCYNYALTHISASRASVFINGVPVVTVVAGWLVLGERFTPVQAAGGAMVVASVYLVNWLESRTVRRRPAPEMGLTQSV